MGSTVTLPSVFLIFTYIFFLAFVPYNFEFDSEPALPALFRLYSIKALLYYIKAVPGDSCMSSSVLRLNYIKQQSIKALL